MTAISVFGDILPLVEAKEVNEGIRLRTLPAPRRKIMELERQLHDMREQFDQEVSEAVQDMRNEIDGHKREIEELNSLNELQRAQLSDATKELEAQREQLAKSETAMIQLRNEIHDLTGTLETMKGLKEGNETLSSQLSRERSDKNEWIKKVNLRDEEIQKLQTFQNSETVRLQKKARALTQALFNLVENRTCSLNIATLECDTHAIGDCPHKAAKDLLQAIKDEAEGYMKA